MASFDSSSFDTGSFSPLSFFLDAVTAITGGGRSKKKRRHRTYLQLPNGEHVAVNSKAEAQKLLNEYYAAEEPGKSKRKLPKLTRKTVKTQPDRSDDKIPAKEVFIYTPVRVKPIAPGAIADKAILEATWKRKIRQRKEEEALLLLIA